MAPAGPHQTHHHPLDVAAAVAAVPFRTNHWRSGWMDHLEIVGVGTFVVVAAAAEIGLAVTETESWQADGTLQAETDSMFVVASHCWLGSLRTVSFYSAAVA